MMKQMGGMMGLPGARRKATKSPKNKRKGTKGGGSGPRVPGGFPGGGMPQLPPGMDPSALPGADAFKAPRLDFGKLMNKDKDKDDK
jgi:signal recognition particle subunit SRP54